MADLNYLRTVLANGGSDAPTLNAIRALLDRGQVSDQDLSQLNISGSAPAPQNALSQALDAAKPASGPSAFGVQDNQRMAGLAQPRLGDLDHELVQTPEHQLAPEELAMRDALWAGAGDKDAAARIQDLVRQGMANNQPSTNDLRKQGANFVRNESTGQTIYLGPNGQASDRPVAASQSQAQAQPARMMQVIGTSGGSRVTLSPEQAPDKVNLDYSQNPLQLFGGAKAIYSKDEPGVAYVMGDDGKPKTKVLLGYDMQGSMQLNKANMEMAKDQQSIAQSQAATAHTLEETRASKVNNPDFTASGGGQINPALKGDAFLQQLDPMIAQEVKAIGDGKTPFNPRSQRQMNLLGLVQQYNPDWNATDYQGKQATTKDFATGGKSGQVVQAINQALHHASTVSDAIDALGNYDTLPAVLNPIKNTFDQKVLGDPRQGNFSTAANALAEELKKIYAGGGGSLTELQNWQKSFDPNAGQTQQRSYLAQGMNLLQGAIQSRQEAYQRGMGPSADFGKLFTPQAQEALQKLRGKGYFGGQPESQGAPQGQSFASLPNPAQFSGKRMQDDKGNIYRSNGSAWVRQ